MGLKTKINSLRCQKWYGFAKQKMMVLRDGEIPFKAYVINGYHIILKALINLAIIKAPPGIAIFRKGRDKNNKPAVVINYADMYGTGKEKLVEIQSLRDVDSTKPPLNPIDSGWPGNILPLALGGYDFIHLLFGSAPDTSVETPYPFYYRLAMYLSAFAPASYSIRYKRGFATRKEGSANPNFFSVANVGDNHYFSISEEVRLSDAGYVTLLFGFSENKPYGNFGLIQQELEQIKSRWEEPEHTWDRVNTVYSYLWKHFNPTKNRDVARICWLIEGTATGFTHLQTVWFFTELEVYTNYNYDFAFMGETYEDQVSTIFPYSEYPSVNPLYATYFAGAPNTQATHFTKVKTLVFPIANGELVFAQWNLYYAPDKEVPVVLVVNENNTPYLHTGLNIPFTYSLGDPEKEYKNPFCVRISEYPLPALYLYWEEWMLYGAEQTDIKNLKYGTPLVPAGWIDIPYLDEGWHMTNFMPIKITWDHRIILAVAYYEADPQDGGGMHTALLDTEKSNNWIIGSRFSETRLDRCSPTVFGEHPYVFERMKYGGTQWGWDYSYCENYPEPPEGYP